ncbi:PAS domain S-box protein [Oscillatoria sp. FACHB-1407]|uniref:PAS domain-containing hybrid sensor histidine kinase/response regulator n=1 Tax=Oscillatoria sp. FACHB-1407 TaxID=2692847 RepID=UPI001684C3CA|nr:PAS domain S-box protein [Oscillatoria sp. FACHB-1407]MBD2462063.1 PAS domain S-box protein [Oscillatoria sp. FACHB-1407]
MQLQNLSFATRNGRVVLIYAFFSSLWILLSDHLLQLWFGDSTPLTRFQTIKGWLFVAVTSALLYVLIHKSWRSLQKSYNLLINILEGTTDGIFLKDLQGRYLVINPAASQILGKSVSEIVGKRDIELLPADMMAEVLASDRIVLETQQAHILEESFVVNGDRRTYLTSRNVWRDRRGQVAGLIGITQDVTQYKQVQQALQESEERLRLVLQSMPVMLDAFDGKGNITVWNQECERVTGYTAEEVVGNPQVMQLLYPNSTYLQTMMEQWRSGGNDYRNWEWDMTCKDGSIRRVAWSNISDKFPVSGWAAWGIGVDVTDRTRAEMALRESEERWQLALRGNNDGIWDWNVKTNAVFFSVRWKEMLGYADHEFANDFDEWYRHVHPQDIAQVMQLMQDHFDKKTPFYISEHRMQCKDGSYKWVLDRGQALWDTTGTVVRMAGSHTDITERKYAEAALWQSNQALEERVSQRTAALAELNDHLSAELLERQWIEAALRESECKFRAVFDQAFQCIGLLKPDGTALEINQTLLAFAGTTYETVIERPFAELSIFTASAGLQEQVQQAIAQAALGHLFRSEITVLDVDGNLVTLDFSIKPIRNEADEVVLLISEGRDITQRKQAEEQLRLSNERISLANAELARATRLKDEFLANMSHELRTPLNAILGLSEALQEQVFGTLSDRQRHSLQTIEQSGRYLLELINDILDLSKIESGRMDLQLATVSVEQLCESSLAFVRQQAHQKNILLHSCIPADLGHITLDERRMRQALINLLSNAVKFTPDGGEIRLEVQPDSTHQRLQFSVIDTGIGIAAEHIPKLFKPFVQLDSSLTRRYTGTGLGLALVRRIVELHKGGVTLESEIGQGSRFTLTLPWKKQVTPTISWLNTFVEADLSRLQRVVIIEDSSPATSQIARYLSELKVCSVIHSYGEGAIEQILRVMPDLVVLDILLPDMSGWEILSQLKSHPRIRHIPVLITSVIDERSHAATFGAADYLVKPTSRRQFQAALSKILASSIESSASPVTHPPASSCPVLLLAEDSEANISMMVDYLEAHGYQLILARNGREAVQQAKTHHPDLILMDIQMPDIDGIEAIRQIRTDSHLMHVPIIALTALAMPGDRDRCLAAGANDYMTKPVSLKELVNAVANYIHAHS